MQLTEPDRMILEAKFGVTNYGLFNRFVANAVLEAQTRFNRRMALYEAGKIKELPVMESEKEAFNAKMMHLRHRADHNPDEIAQAEASKNHEEPPAGIADLFQADKPLAPQAPAEIADLIDPSLTPKQNLDVLTAKFAAAKNLEEYARNNGDMTGAMQHLRDAERFESGIKWNRAVLVEVV